MRSVVSVVRGAFLKPRRFLQALLLLAGAGGVGVLGAFVWWQYHFRAAENALKEFRFEQAVRHFEKCLAVWPRSASVHLQAAQAARRGDDYERAERHLNECERWGGPSNSLRLERVLLQAQQGDVEEGETPLYKLVNEDHPQTDLILEALAKGHLVLINSNNAEHALTLLLEKQPKHFTGRFLRGTLREDAERNDEAAEDLQVAVEQGPWAFDPRLHLADVLTKLGRIREAIYHYEWLRSAHPPHPRVLVGLGKCRMDQEELEEASRRLDNALAVDPGDVPALVELGRLALRKGEARTALAGLRRAASLAPNDRDAHWVLHLCLEALGQREEDEHCLAVVFRIEDEQLRMRSLVERLNQGTNDPALFYELGTLLLQFGRDREGVHMLSMLVESNPHHQTARQALVEYSRRTGKPLPNRLPALEENP
jgi:tetratricopeptide (TPR) repeat protein